MVGKRSFETVLALPSAYALNFLKWVHPVSSTGLRPYFDPALTRDSIAT
jgi:hypothetical protein